jgi:hypothetical protein
VVRNHHVAFPLRPDAVSSKKTEDAAHAVFRRCTTVGVFSCAENPIAIRCRPSPH